MRPSKNQIMASACLRDTLGMQKYSRSWIKTKLPGRNLCPYRILKTVDYIETIETGCGLKQWFWTSGPWIPWRLWSNIKGSLKLLSTAVAQYSKSLRWWAGVWSWDRRAGMPIRQSTQITSCCPSSDMLWVLPPIGTSLFHPFFMQGAQPVLAQGAAHLHKDYPSRTRGTLFFFPVGFSQLLSCLFSLALIPWTSQCIA